MNATARQLIAMLGLEPLPREGGFFRQTWCSGSGSAIVFLLTPENFSALHRLEQDELWHFYAGDPVEHVQLDPRDGAARISRLGPDVLAGDQPQVLVPAGVWQGARIAAGRDSDPPSNARGKTGQVKDPSSSLHGFALLGCTVSPPWDEQQFELGRRAELLLTFPRVTTVICALTR